MAILYDRNGTFIEEITLDLSGNGKRWVKKTREFYLSLNESDLIKKYLLGCNTAVEIPPIMQWHGKLEKKYWYIMEKYDGSLYKNMLFGKKHWKKLLIDVVNFLRHIHRQGVVHGDIKEMNILYQAVPIPKFVVCDYEFIRKPDPSTVCKNNNTDCFYYSLLGCEEGYPYFSYKADLTSFGYILWKVLDAVTDRAVNFLWQRKAGKEYNEGNEDYTLYEIDRDREIEDSHMPIVIKEYFSIISRINWFQTSAPDGAIYDELMRLDLN